jgi:hypothetical protein
MADSETALRALQNPLLTAALSYAKRGWPVFPCAPRSKIPATVHGFKDATTNEKQIRAWWTDNPNYNVAIATGQASGLFVFDVDQKPERTIDEALGDLPVLPDAPTVETGGGGYQYFWRYPAGSDLSISGGKLGVGIDTRGNGGYVVAPPSIHPSGKPYRWFDLVEAELPPTPTWVVDRLTAKVGTHLAVTSNGKLTGGRHDTLMTAAALMRTSGLIGPEIYAALNEMVKRLDLSDGRTITDKEVRDIAQWADGKEVGLLNVEHVVHGKAVADALTAPKPAPFAFHIQGPEEWRVPLKKREWLIDQFLPMGGVGLICSSPGKGKSLLLVELAEAVALGRDFGPFPTKQGKVLFCAPDSPLSTQYRLQGVSAQAASNISFAPMVSIPKHLADIGGGFALLIVDTYDRAREHTDSGSAGQDRLIQDVVGTARDFAFHTGTVPVFSHHTTRADEARPRGSQSFDGLCDMIGAISQHGPGTVSLSCLKMRDGNEFEPLTWDIRTRAGLSEEADEVPYLVPSAAQTMTRAAKEIEAEKMEMRVLEVMDGKEPAGGWTNRSLAEAAHIPKGTIQRVLVRMREKGLIE